MPGEMPTSWRSRQDAGAIGHPRPLHSQLGPPHVTQEGQRPRGDSFHVVPPHSSTPGTGLQICPSQAGSVLTGHHPQSRTRSRWRELQTTTPPGATEAREGASLQATQLPEQTVHPGSRGRGWDAHPCPGLLHTSLTLWRHLALSGHCPQNDPSSALSYTLSQADPMTLSSQRWLVIFSYGTVSPSPAGSHTQVPEQAGGKGQGAP